MLIVGIDPDTKKHGVAFMQDNRLLSLHSLPTDDLVRVLVIKASDPLIIKLENINVHKPVFMRAGQSRNQMMKIAQNVGAVKYAATLLIDQLTAAGLKVNLVNPLPKSLSGKRFNQESFNKFTGWQGSSNGDTRDAAMIAWFGSLMRGQQFQVSGG